MFNFFKKTNQQLRAKKEENKIGPKAYIFVGRSGCGKGTQAELLMNKLKEIDNSKILHIETGALLREFAKNSSYTAKKTKEIIDTGGLMPESIVISLCTSYLMDNFSGKENLVFDGAPRRLLETEILDNTLKFYNISRYKVVYMNVSREWATKRLLARGRTDDTKEDIEKRMSWFDKDVRPSVEFFKNNESCEFIDINGEQTIEQVHDEITKKVFNMRK